MGHHGGVGTRILAVEDDERIRSAVKLALEDEGWNVDEADSGEQAIEIFQRSSPDIVLIDIMLPGMDGFEVCRAIRKISDVPIVMVTARADTHDVVAGLEAGADDYLTKPFAFEELVARVRALVRRKYGTKDPVRRVGQLRVDTARRAVSCGKKPIPLTPSEYAVLEYLVARRGQVVSKTDLLDHLHAGAGEGSDNSIEVLIHQLRRKIRTAEHPGLIRTRRGYGYIID